MVDTPTLPVLEVRKKLLRLGKEVADGHTMRKLQSQDLGPDLPVSHSGPWQGTCSRQRFLEPMMERGEGGNYVTPITAQVEVPSSHHFATVVAF